MLQLQVDISLVKFCNGEQDNTQDLICSLKLFGKYQETWNWYEESPFPARVTNQWKQ